MTTSKFFQCRLAEISTVKGGKRLPANAKLVSTPTLHPYIRGRDIRNGRVSFAEPLYVLDEDFEKIRRYTVDSGDVCITIVGNIGDVAIVPRHLHGASLTENAVKLVELDERVNARFLMYALLSPEAQSQMKLSAAGAAQPKLGIYKVNEIKVPLPSLCLQVKISSILSAYDDLIENNTRRIEILEEMARRLYEEWFVQFRFPGHEGVAFKKMLIHDVADVVRGRSYRSADLIENGRPFVNLKCINRDGGYRRDGLKYYSGKYKPEQLVSSGDIVMAVTDMTQERRIVARAALVPDLGEMQGVISMDLVRIIPKDGVSALYLYAFFRWSDFSDNVKNHATGANVLHLHPDLIANYDIDLPPQEVCKSFEDKVRPAIELADVLEKKNANLRAQRDLLLPKLISGEIDVSDIPMPT